MLLGKGPLDLVWTQSNLGNFNFDKGTLNLWVALDDFGYNQIA